MSKRQWPRPARAERKEQVRDVFVGRPFEGLADETEWVGLRELVPAATAPLRLADPQLRGPHVDAGDRAADGVARAGEAGRPDLPRPAGRGPLGRPEPRPRLGAGGRAGDRARRVRRGQRPARARARGCRTCSPTTARSTPRCTTRSASGSTTSRRRPRGDARAWSARTPRSCRPRRMAAAQSGVLVPRARPRPRPLGPARRRGPRPGHPRPAAGGRRPARSATAPSTRAPSARTACSSRSGTCRAGPRGGRAGRTRSPPSPKRYSEALADDGPLTREQHRARARRLRGRQLTLR